MKDIQEGKRCERKNVQDIPDVRQPEKESVKTNNSVKINFNCDKCDSSFKKRRTFDIHKNKTHQEEMKVDMVDMVTVEQVPENNRTETPKHDAGNKGKNKGLIEPKGNETLKFKCGQCNNTFEKDYIREI